MPACKHRIKGMKKPLDLKEYARAFASKGGNARAKKLSAEERKAIAKKAAQVRWNKGGKKNVTQKAR